MRALAFHVDDPGLISGTPQGSFCRGVAQNDVALQKNTKNKIKIKEISVTMSVFIIKVLIGASHLNLNN